MGPGSTPGSGALSAPLAWSAGLDFSPMATPGPPGPEGPPGTLATIGRLDTTHSPVGLWHLNGNLNDSSGNGRNLTVSTGTVVYADIWPGCKGVLFNSLRLTNTNAAFRIAGDITIELVMLVNGTPNAEALFCCTGVGEVQADNAQWEIFFSTLLLPTWFSEHGAGVNDQFAQTVAAVPIGTPFHFAAVRQSNVISMYVNGVLLGTVSGALTTPDGGTAASLFLGGDPNNVTSSFVCSDAKVIASALTAAQVLAEAELTIGQLY